MSSLEVWPSGQWQQTVNLPGFALRRFESSRLHHSFPVRGSNSGVESQPSKLLVAGSNPVSRSIPLAKKTAAAPRREPPLCQIDEAQNVTSRDVLVFWPALSVTVKTTV